MANYNFNCVLNFIEESIVYYIERKDFTSDMYSFVQYSREKSTKVYHVHVIWKSYQHEVTSCYTNHKLLLFVLAKSLLYHC